MSNVEIFESVIEKVGSMTRLAKLIGDPLSTVNNWRQRGIPAPRCKQVETLTGVSVRHLRPSDWPLYWPDDATQRRWKKAAGMK